MMDPSRSGRFPRPDDIQECPLYRVHHSPSERAHESRCSTRSTGAAERASRLFILIFSMRRRPAARAFFRNIDSAGSVLRIDAIVTGYQSRRPDCSNKSPASLTRLIETRVARLGLINGQVIFRRILMEGLSEISYLIQWPTCWSTRTGTNSVLPIDYLSQSPFLWLDL